jgi:ABC-2 type transport system permease protein
VRFFAAAFSVEARKLRAARVVQATTVFLVLGVTAIATGMTIAARSGNAAVIAKLGPAAALTGWDGLVAVVLQITAAAAVLAFGVVLSWLVGREFADGTVTGLFALPVSRPTIVTAKLAIYLMWTVGVGIAMLAATGTVGLMLGLPAPAAGVGPLLARLAVLTVLSGLVAMPAAWAATIGRGVLPGIATTIGIIAVAQIMAVGGVGAWFPLTAPALWAIAPGAVSPAQLALVLAVPTVFGPLTLRAWSTLQLDR